jgi:hypothetical protein
MFVSAMFVSAVFVSAVSAGEATGERLLGFENAKPEIRIRRAFLVSILMMAFAPDIHFEMIILKDRIERAVVREIV